MISLCDWSFETKVIIVCDLFIREPTSIVYCLSLIVFNQPLTKLVSTGWWRPVLTSDLRRPEIGKSRNGPSIWTAKVKQAETNPRSIQTGPLRKVVYFRIGSNFASIQIFESSLIKHAIVSYNADLPRQCLC